MICTSIAEEFASRIWDLRDLTAVDELLDQEVMIHSLLGCYCGKEAMRQVIHIWFKAFPDLTVTNFATISEKDRVVIQWQAEGTHKGEFKGIKPKGNRVTYQGATVYRVEENKITEYWAYLDMQDVLRQINA